MISSIPATVLALPAVTFESVLFRTDGSSITLGQVAIAVVGLLLLLIGFTPLKRGLKLFFKLFRLTPGGQEVVGNLFAYGLLLIAVFLYLRWLGINLTSLTVFASVIGLGIGLGLQKLVNNFFSGLLLLLERPIQVGDAIDVEGMSGIVESISVRFTVLRTFDNLRILVPNSELTEKRIVNYDYTDRRCRIRLPVFVAPEAVASRVSEALLEAARQEPEVLRSPRPEVFLEAIEPRQLRFVLSAWVANSDNFYRMKSNLNFAMNEALDRYRIPRPVEEVHFDRRPVGDPAGESREYLSDLLTKLDLFSSFGHAQLSRLIELGSTQSAPAGEAIFRRGEPGDAMYLILRGSVEVLSADESTVLASLEHGHFFGEMAMLLGIPRTATIRTKQPCELFVIHDRDLKVFLGQWPDVEERISQVLKSREAELRGLGQMPELPDNRSLVQQFRERVRMWFAAS